MKELYKALEDLLPALENEYWNVATLPLEQCPTYPAAKIAVDAIHAAQALNGQEHKVSLKDLISC